MKHFPKCNICGTRGHTQRTCPVRDLNARQEQMQRRALTQNISLGLTPQLEREIEMLRASWKLLGHGATV